MASILLMSMNLAEAQLEEIWRATYRSKPTGVTDDQTLNALVDAEENVILTGSTVTVKYDRGGNLKWVLPRPGTDMALIEGGDFVLVHPAFPTIRVSSDGNVVWENTNVVASTVGIDAMGRITVPGFDSYGGFKVSKLSPSGLILWEVDYRGKFSNGGGLSLASGPTGETFVLGLSDLSGPLQTARMVVQRIDAEGELSWIKLYEGGKQNSQGTAIEVDSSGNAIITGGHDIYSEDLPSETFLVRYDAAGDAEVLNLFRSTLSSELGRQDYGVALALGLDGSCFVLARAASGSTRKAALLKFDSNGERKWASFLTDIPIAPFAEVDPIGALVPDLIPRTDSTPLRSAVTRISRLGVREWTVPLEVAGALLNDSLVIKKLLVVSKTNLIVAGFISRQVEPMGRDNEYHVRKFVIKDPQDRPKIVRPPTDQLVAVGNSQTLSVDGVEPNPTPEGIRYQWLFQGRQLENATTFSHTVSKVGMTNSGWYSVTVSNQWGAVASPDVLLTAGVTLEQPALSPGGQLSFSFGSEPGVVYSIQVTTNPHSWTETSSLQADTDVTQYTEAMPFSDDGRFYRVLVEFPVR